LKLLQDEQFESVKLRRLAEAIRRNDAAGAIGRLAKFVEILSQRDKEYFYAISRVLLIGLQTALRVEKWQKKHGDSLKDWLSGWGEFEALLALGVYAREHPQNAFPEILTNEIAYRGLRLGNPLLLEQSLVPNDVALNRETRFYIISGSNMAGKSTLLRTVGLNAILAYSGAPVRAATLQLSIFSICASLSVVDSLLEGKSKFLAEIDRMRQAIDLATTGSSVLFLFDEILSGTNSRDRRIAAEAIVRFLVAHGALGMLSTHDLALTQIVSPEFGERNVHMGSRDGFDPLDFDYLLKPGVTTETNAIEIARLAGVPI
jgi:DNA mismatch repair ATPase MutS